MNKILAVVSVLLLLSGCVPMSFTYHKPLGPGGYFKNQCGGPDNFLGFTAANGLGVMVDTSNLGAGRREVVAVSFHLGDAHTLKFASAQFLVVSEVPEKTTSYTVSEVVNLEYIKQSDGRWTQQKKSFPINAELQGALRPAEFRSVFAKAFQNYRSYSLELPVREHKQQNFTLKFPHIVLDGRELTIPDIKVEYRTAIHLSFIC
jgi:hypothetical protein